MNEPSHIERIVMQRVHLIHALRFAVSGSVFSGILSVLALWGIGTQVWVARVLQNAPASPFDLLGFYFSAFTHTGPAVQILVLLLTISFLYLAREIYKAVAIMRISDGF